MEMDLYKPGNILFSTRSALKTTDGKTEEIILGSDTEYGFADGIGKSVRFNQLYGFHQISNYTILGVDRDNNCIRKLDRKLKPRVARSIGLCPNTIGLQDGNLSTARFNRPIEIIADNQVPNHYLITEERRAIRHLDLQGRYVSTFLLTRGHFEPWGIAQDGTSGNLYLTSFSSNVFFVNYKSKVVSLLTGSEYAFKDGNFASAMFWYPREIIIFENGTKLIIVDQNGPGLRLLDLQTNTTSTFCDKAFESFKVKSTRPDDNEWNRCGEIRGNRLRGYSLLKYGDKLLVGGDSRVLAIGGKQI